MSTETTAPRPRQVTLAASLVMAASVLLVLSVFERLGSLRSLESRTSIQRFLSEPPGSSLGLGTEAVLDIVRTVSMVAAGLATAAAILGYHVLKRNRAARVGLSVLVLPLFLCGLVTGGFLSSVVAASVAMLWLAPARHWFSGEAPPVAPGPAPPYPPRADADRPTPTVTPGPPAADQPPPWPSYGAPAPWAGPAQTAGRQRAPRPTPLVVACVVTWACCALTALVAVLLVAVLAFDADGLFAEMHRQNPTLADQGISDATLESATWVSGVVCLLWSLVSGALAVGAFRRVRWAVVALIVSAGLVAVLCLGGSLLSPVLVVPGVLAALVGVLLLQPAVHRWLDRGRDAPAAQRPRNPWA